MRQFHSTISKERDLLRELISLEAAQETECEKRLTVMVSQECQEKAQSSENKGNLSQIDT